MLNMFDNVTHQHPKQKFHVRVQHAKTRSVQHVARQMLFSRGFKPRNY